MGYSVSFSVSAPFKPLKCKAFHPSQTGILDNKRLDRTGEAERSFKSDSWRYGLQAFTRSFLRPTDGSKPPPVCLCCRFAARTVGGGLVERGEIRRTESKRARFDGLQRCGSAWLCAVCAKPYARKQARKTLRAFKACWAKGGTVFMVTSTVGRDPGEALASVKGDLCAAAAAARECRAWRKAKKAGLLFGAMPFVEVLHGRWSGWHPHLHTAVFFKCSAAEAYALLAAYRSAYIAYLERVGRPVDAEAQHSVLIGDEDALSNYVSKNNAAFEVSGGVKAARSRTSRSIWDLLTLAKDGDEGAASLAREYAKEMPGTRSGVLSAGLAERLGLTEEDDEGGDDEPEEESDLIGSVHVDVLCRVSSNGHLSDLCQAVESFEGWSTLEDRIFEWARCSEDERRCYDELLADALQRKGGGN